jgi:hypothetical protein
LKPETFRTSEAVTPEPMTDLPIEKLNSFPDTRPNEKRLANTTPTRIATIKIMIPSFFMIASERILADIGKRFGWTESSEKFPAAAYYFA